MGSIYINDSIKHKNNGFNGREVNLNATTNAVYLGLGTNFNNIYGENIIVGCASPYTNGPAQVASNGILINLTPMTDIYTNVQLFFTMGTNSSFVLYCRYSLWTNGQFWWSSWNTFHNFTR